MFHFDRPSKTLNRLMQYEYYGYPRDFIFQYQKAIAAVTKADVLRVAQKYFKPQDLTYVAVGNPQEFGTPLIRVGHESRADRPDDSRAEEASVAENRRGQSGKGQGPCCSECSRRWAAPTNSPR